MGIPPSRSYRLRGKSNPLTTCIFCRSDFEISCRRDFQNYPEHLVIQFCRFDQFQHERVTFLACLPCPLGFEIEIRSLYGSSQALIYFNPVGHVLCHRVTGK